jgi:hypothetical protein
MNKKGNFTHKNYLRVYYSGLHFDYIQTDVHVENIA